MNTENRNYIRRRFQAWPTGKTKSSPASLWLDNSPESAQKFIEKYNEQQNVGCSVMMFPPGTHQTSANEAPVWTDILVFDFDDKKNLENAHRAALKLDNWFISDLGISEGRIRRYFSGAAGFHIEVDMNIFEGFTPNFRLNEQLEWIRQKAREHLGKDGSVIDDCFKAKDRIIRFPNSINHKTGLRKVFLTKYEFDDTIDVFKMLAKEERPIEEFYGPISVNSCCGKLVQKCLEEIPAEDPSSYFERLSDVGYWKKLVREKVSIDELFREWGIEYDDGNNKYFCPFHDEGQNPNGHVYHNPDGDYYKCFSSKCGFSGHAIDIYIKKNKGMLFPQALRDLVERLGRKLPGRLFPNNTKNKRDNNLRIVNQLEQSFAKTFEGCKSLYTAMLEDEAIYSDASVYLYKDEPVFGFSASKHSNEKGPDKPDVLKRLNYLKIIGFVEDVPKNVIPKKIISNIYKKTSAHHLAPFIIMPRLELDILTFAEERSKILKRFKLTRPSAKERDQLLDPANSKHFFSTAMALSFTRHPEKDQLLEFSRQLFNEYDEMTESELIKELQHVERSKKKIYRTLPLIKRTLGLELVYRNKRKT